jgi:uncharacterized protein (TIGR00251 family)
MSFLRESKDGLLLAIKVTPRSGSDQITGVDGSALKIRLKAPPVDGKANDQLIRFLSGLLEVPPSEIRIVRGQTSREKVLLVTGSGSEELRNRLHLTGPSR